MSVRRRGSRWQADFAHQGKRYRHDCAGEAEALAWEADARARLLRGEKVGGSGGDRTTCSTLEQLREEVLATHWRSAKTQSTYSGNTRDVIDLLGAGRHPSTVDRVSLDRLEKLLEERGNSDATINRKLTALSVMLKYAEERGWITRTPKIKKRREREGRIRWISREEELHIIQWFEHRGYQSMSDFCAVLLDSGFRSGEAMNLRWEDTIDGKLTLHPGETKNGEARFVRQTDRVVGIVDRRSKSRPVGSPRVFWDLTQDSVRHLWDKMRDGLGLADDTQFVPHCLRHTVASRLVQSGKALSFVQRFLGHKSITVTQRYAHLAPSNLEECTTVLNNYQNGLNLSRPPESSQDAGCDECATYGKICGGQKVVSA